MKIENSKLFLQQNFPDFFYDKHQLFQVSFFHIVTENPEGLDDVNPVPFAFTIRQKKSIPAPESLFILSGLQIKQTVFFGSFDLPYSAFCFLTDEFIPHHVEAYQSPYYDLIN
jgi:hypothetical protein